MYILCLYLCLTDYASVYAYVYLSTPTDIINFINSNLMYYGKSRERNPKISKQYLFYPVKSKSITERVSKASQKFSSKTCFTYLIKSSILVFSVAIKASSKISKSTYFIQSSLNILQSRQQSKANISSNTFLPFQIIMYHKGSKQSKQSKPKILK